MRLHDEPKDFDSLAELNDRLGLPCTDFIFNHPDAGVKAALIEAQNRALILDSLGAMIKRAGRVKCHAFISGAGNVVPGTARRESERTAEPTPA